MRVLVAGASGFIGSGVAAFLLSRGIEVVAAGRNIGAARRRLPWFDWVQADFNRDLDPADWSPRLAGVDAVVNCVGVLQDGGGDSTQRAHIDGADALFAACEQAGVRRVVHISAAGVEADTAYARTKAEGEARLRGRNLDWVILRPSLVIGETVYGGTATIRTLAGIPGLTPIVQPEAQFQPIGVEELARTVAHFLTAPAETMRATLNVAGPRPMRLDDIVAGYRKWLGFGRTRFVRVPGFVEAAAFAVGDALGRLGVRTSMRSTSRKQMAFGAAADPADWIAATGIQPRALEQIFAERPATVQDRWHARLSALLPLLTSVFGLYWVATGVLALWPGWSAASAMLRDAGFGAASGAMLAATAVADIVLGLWLLSGARRRLCLALMLALSLAYCAAIALLAPGLLLDPLGAGLKTVLAPLLVLVLMAVLAER